MITPKKSPIPHPLFWATLLPQAGEASSGDLVVVGACVHGYPKHLVLALRERVVGDLVSPRRIDWDLHLPSLGWFPFRNQ